MERKTINGTFNKDHGEVAVIFGISSDMAFALANVLFGLRRHSPELLQHVIVYHDGLSDDDKNTLLLIAPCQFKIYNPDFPGGKPVICPEYFNTYTLNMFARYEGFRLLDEYDAVIWFDVDILINSNVAILLDIVAKHDEGIGMCLENRDWFKFGDNFIKEVPGYDMGSPTFNSGLLVLTRDLKNAKDIYPWLYNATVEYAEYLRWPDQGILNIMLKKFQIIPTCLPSDIFNRNPAGDSDGKAVIVHSYGPKKFWNNPGYYIKYPQWQDNHKKWSVIRERRQSQNSQPIVSVVIP
jgi:lipopolysaccharide biosynthesis glycosyltransferase